MRSICISLGIALGVRGRKMQDALFGRGFVFHLSIMVRRIC